MDPIISHPFVNEPTAYEKNEECILCHNSWWSHEGWLCPKEPGRTDYEKVRFDVTKIPRTERFWTKSMRELAAQGKYNQLHAHIHHNKKNVTSNVVKAEDETPDWKRFQHTAPGDCPCGISRSTCEYHHR